MNSITGLAFCTLGILATSVVQAQQSDEGGLQEVIVTAQKRSESLQNVPLSIAAVNEQQIIDSGAANLVDLARNVAGFYIADLGPGQSQIAIRGVSSGQVIRDQPGVKEQVGVYLDESPISVALFTPDLELFDIDRIEVLRGPQGTLFGAGSESGTVRYITRQPQLGKSEVITDAWFEKVQPDKGGAGAAARGAINVPLGGTVALRLAAFYHHLPGFIEALQPSGSSHRAVNDGDRAGFRLSMLWKPTDALSVEPRFVYQNLGTNGFPRVDLFNILANPYTTTQPAVTIGDRQQYTQQGEGLSDDFRMGDLKVDYDFGPATLTSISSYTNRHVLVTRDATQLTGSVTFQIGGPTPEVRVNSPLLDHTHLSVISQELRLTSNGKQMIDWLGGAFFQHAGRRYGQALPTAGYDAFIGAPSSAFNAPADHPFYSDLGYRFRQYAVFGEATWHVTDPLSLTGGVRYYNFREDKTLLFGGVFTGSPVQGLTYNVNQNTSSNGVSPRGIISFKLTPDVELYGQAARGFRLGGINDPLNVALCQGNDIAVFGNQKNWRDEKLWNYELGAKTQFLDHRLTFNVALYYDDIKDLQATTTAGSCSSRIVFNVPTARSEGLEAELFARPTPNWDLGISATVIDAKLTSSVTSTPAPGQTLVVGGLASGNRLPTAPKFQSVAFAGYTLPLADGNALFANLTVQYVGSSFSQFENEEPNFGVICASCGLPNAAGLIPYGSPSVSTITFNPELPSYALANLRLGWKGENWQFAAYVNNLTDKTARLALDYERGRRARVGFLTNQPQTIGVYYSRNF